MPRDIAFAASARPWPDRVHRYVLDHGGARVVGRVLASDQVESTQCEVLLVDDVCSFLTPHFVQNVRARGTEVVGVYSPEDGPDAKRRLLDCGIADVIESEATAEEFLRIVDSAASHRTPESFSARETSRLFSVGVTGAAAGVGITEVSIALSMALAKSDDAVLLDLDQVWPSIAQRLGLPMHPNIRTVLDAIQHRSGEVTKATFEVGNLLVIGGRADIGSGAPIERAEVMALTSHLSEAHHVLVADLGTYRELATGVAREFDVLVVVGAPDPVGVGRISQIVDDLGGVNPGQSVVAVVNGIRRRSFETSEIVAELARAHPTLPVLTLPSESKVRQAAWNGEVVKSGPFVRQVTAMAGLIEKAADGY